MRPSPSHPEAGDTATSPASSRAPLRRRRQARLARTLAWVAGIVDAVLWITLAHVFTAHMSGNSVQLGVAISKGDWGDALTRGLPVPLFVLAVFTGVGVAEAAARRRARSALVPLLALEIVLLLAAMAVGAHAFGDRELRSGGGATFYLVLALAVVAMGLQTASLQRVGGKTARTTYITGMLTNLATESVGWILARTSDRRGHHLHGQRVLLLGSIWLSYAFGAVVGGLLQARWALLGLCLPLAVLAALILLDLWKPSGVAEASIAAAKKADA